MVVPTHLYCGLCFNCVRGYTAACLRVRPGSFGAAYGYAGMGAYRGAGGLPIGYGTLVVVYLGVAAAVVWILRRLAGAPLEPPAAKPPVAGVV